MTMQPPAFTPPDKSGGFSADRVIKMADKQLADIILKCGCHLSISKLTYGYVKTCWKHRNKNAYDILKTVRLRLT